jgi:hypothetical protein
VTDRADWVNMGAASEGTSWSEWWEGVPGEPDLDPASRAVARTPAPVQWTIGDALAFLHPCPPRRTVSRWLRHMDPIGERPLPQGGPPAATYSASEIMTRHARWARRISV